MSIEPSKHDQSVPSPRASAYDAELEREIEAALGYMDGATLIHADDLVITAHFED
jgi:hypothetical protein